MNDLPILQELDQIRQQALEALGDLRKETELAAWRNAYLSRTAPVMKVFSSLGSVPKEQRPAVGQAANQVKVALEAAFEERSQAIKTAALQQALETERLDVTLPGRPLTQGRLHPETQAMREVCQVLSAMGFQEFRSPEVETDELNFELLNIPRHHPARDMFDTFYTDRQGVILRTHTSPGQIHAMRTFAPDPIRVMLPGMCYRYEQVSTRHEAQFNQVELLAVGRGITFANLKGTLLDFFQRLFGPRVHIRLRPSYFPFTEPSGEVDVECFLCEGKGCPVCKGSGWLEIGGCGMVHPVVLRNGGYDPEEFTGFAAGLGPARIAMLRHGIKDIRNFWGNDIRFLEQF